MISACDSCGAIRELDQDWHCAGCARDTEPCPPPSCPPTIHPPALHAAVLRYDGEDWEGAGGFEYELALQDMGRNE